MNRLFDTPRQEDPHAQLERAFIEEYLRARRHSLATLQMLPTAEADAMLREASLYASGRLTEVESRAHLVNDLHCVPQAITTEPCGAGRAAAAALPDVAPQQPRRRAANRRRSVAFGASRRTLP